MADLTYKNFKLFNGKDNELYDDSWFTVDTETGKLTKVGQGTAPEGAVDLGGRFVMPGLMNCHTHIVANPNFGDGGFRKGETETAVHALNSLRALLKSGVTYIRECGSAFDVDITFDRLTREGKLDKVPHIMPSGGAFSMTGGHGDFPNMGVLVDSPDEMRHQIRLGLKHGVKAVKIIATGGVMTPGDEMSSTQLSVEEMRTAVEESHHQGAPVAAHAEGNPGIMNALEAGVDSIEHGFYVNDEEADYMKEHGTYLTPTLIAAWGVGELAIGKIPDWETKKMQNALEDGFANIKNAWQKGVKVTLGTDAGTPFNDFTMTPVELQLMVEHEDVTPYQALETSWNAATLMKVDKEYGSLEEGKFADFLVLDENPLEDIKAVQQADKEVYLSGARQF
ncbi:metal-dependent hydrolase family protein [Fructobacillus ficulneus]|uniref:Imidazolonepropionase related amidohydrolase n=1 Tax=Fructobacillus ficulneus TaxID=157463 RepID=A0A0K8MHD9_9LACO|nr:amidohydrolase family protein [Fructobacillus ficulneus]GAO99314.1 imidazolonepropionase related amidohydrolase [Fructobacillus ficulneus]